MKNTMKKIGIVCILSIILLAPGTSFASDTKLWYSTEEQQRIDSKLADLQKQVDELKKLNDSLEYRILQVEKKPITTQTTVQITDQETKTKVKSLESRVGTLEKAVSFLQTKVMDALNTTIGLLKQLLKIK